MRTTRRQVLAAGAGFGLMPMLSRPSRAQAANTIRIGVLNDQSGPYRDISGPYGVALTQMAVDEFGARGFRVEVISADHQNKPDVGAGIARQWYDRDGVDLIIDVPTSSVGLAVNQVAREKNKAYINTGAATSDLTGVQCTPVTISWMYDTYMLAKSTGGAMVKAGGDSWFFITADYAFGHALEADAARVVKQEGGTVVGGVRHPTAAADFSSFLLQAQASRAQVIALANAVGDTVNSVKQAAEFGITGGGQDLAALLMQLSDVHAIGLKDAQGLYLTEGFYWDTDPGTRAFADRFAQAMKGRRPTANQAGVYAGALAYLRAAAASGSTDGRTVVARMKAEPTNDPLFGEGRVREDGRHIHPMYLFQVKTPAESKGPFDYYKRVQTIPAAEAFRPLLDKSLAGANYRVVFGADK